MLRTIDHRENFSTLFEMHRTVSRSLLPDHERRAQQEIRDQDFGAVTSKYLVAVIDSSDR